MDREKLKERKSLTKIAMHVRNGISSHAMTVCQNSSINFVFIDVLLIGSITSRFSRRDT